MNLWVDVLKEAFPKAAESLKDGLAAMRTARKRRQHIFVLKAMTRPNSVDIGVSLLSIEGRRYDLTSIESSLCVAQLEEATNSNGYVALMLSPDELEPFCRELRTIEKSTGYPQLMTRCAHENLRRFFRT